MQTAHARQWSDDGVESDRDADYFEERARGGAGLLILGNQVVHPTGAPGRPGISYTFEPKAHAALARVVERVHAHDTRLFVQINHFGTGATSDADDPRIVWAPSRYTSPATGEQAKGLDEDEIAEVITSFRQAATMVRDAGADGVEIHVAHGYLLNSFLSKRFNTRTDGYGGSAEKRLRLIREVIAAVRADVGADIAVGARMSLGDMLPGGLELDETIAATAALQNEGLLDFVSVSMGAGIAAWYGAQTGYAPEGFLLDPAGTFKAALPGLPVFVVGGINRAEMAENLLATGRADMVAMTRAQIADPELVNKIADGREDEIIHCIRANQGCLSKIYRGMPMTCSVNPAAGREAVFGATRGNPAARPGRWLVIGGGPAGMKAAEGLAMRGHKVVLLEREQELGGQLRLAQLLPGRETWRLVTQDLERRLIKFGVEIRRGVEASADYVLAQNADGVVVATGATPAGDAYTSLGPLDIDRAGATILSVEDAVRNPAGAGRRVLLLDDEGTRAVSGLAELLIAQGAEVLLVTRFNMLFPVAIMTLEMATIYQNTVGRGMKDYTNHWLRRHAGRIATVVNIYSNAESELRDIDSLVLGIKPRPDDGLHTSLTGRVANLSRVGDCVAVRTLDHAIYEGFLAGREQLGWKERPFFEHSRDPTRPIL